MDDILVVNDLCKYYVKKNFFGKKSLPVKAADGISFSIKAGSVFVLAGESGSGKSTIARLILGAEEADHGMIYFNGNRVDYATGNGVKKMRAECQMVHQNPYDSVNPRMRISDIVMEPLHIHHWGNNKKDRMQRMFQVLREVKLEPVEDIAEMFPHQLSGGQRQRVVLARALTLKPKIIIADEPVSMLDVSIRAEMLGIMESLQKRSNIAFLYITHDLSTAKYFGNEIAIMYKGRIVELGPVRTVLDDPRHPYTQALIDAVSDLDPKNLNKKKTIRILNNKTKDFEGCAFHPRCPYAVENCMKEPKLKEIDVDRKVSCFVPIRARS
ncbi:MAG: oligopeptide ABC transporter ATP-binding protein [Cenarchaeum symbiont of Oopsacas minuta]|nr:oligopeptide ABC transporter ATP-binding protein [Cenarchaeum symbiont of Oopsacas minuta]